MTSRLLNVRLTPEDQRVITRLKARGISISEVMRRALRAEDARAASEGVDAEAVIAELREAFPTPPGRALPRVDARDRRAVREHIKDRLRARKR